MTTAATAGETSPEYLGMSDEDFSKMNAPAAPVAAAVVEEPKVEELPVAEVAAEVPVKTAEELAAGDEPLTDKEKAAAKDDVEDNDPPDEVVIAGSEKTVNGKVVKEAVVVPAKEQTPAEKAAAAALAAKPVVVVPPVVAKTDAEKAAEAAAAEAAEPVDYEKFFKKVMTPFKANGRNIELKTPDEAIRLMQMGAGYGRKIQELQPHLKVLRMLEKNDLLDEGKLSLLIDVNSKNPEAIKKIIKDSGIDPLDLNMEDNVSYKPTNHSVSDKEMAFNEAVKVVTDHETGNETLKTINQTWDQESKSALFDQPALLGVIQSQRDNGLYDQIAAEIDRQKLFGTIPQSTPFLQAYQLAGDHLKATNGFKNAPKADVQIQTQVVETPATVIATRVAAPKAQVANGAKAAAASPTKTSGTRKAATAVNPLEMADDDFIKQFNGRL